MSIIDDILGRGAADARFTDWNTARNFVIFDAIVNNPRLSDETKIKLQDMEQDAFEKTSGQWTVSETTEIAQYYQYLQTNFPSLTNDAQFLAIFDAAAQVRADESSIGVDDLYTPEPVKWGGILLALGAIGYLMTQD
jgi:hypothetical protein